MDSYNGEILNTYQRFSNFKGDLYESDSLRNKLLNKKEYENIKNQIVSTNSKWDLNLNLFEGVYSETNYPHKDELDFLYIAKPIYVLDNEYALIYKYSKVEEASFVISAIKVYVKKDGLWVANGTIGHYQTYRDTHEVKSRNIK